MASNKPKSFASKVKQELLDISYNKKHCTTASDMAFMDYAGVPEQMSEPDLSRDCCRRAYLRTAFLLTGTMSDPAKSYHLEFSIKKEAQGRRLLELFEKESLGAKMISRGDSFVVYFKEGDEIADVLNLLGAHKMLLSMENERIIREMRGTVNRRVNCETANINKTVNAATKQTEDIQYIDEELGLSALPEQLQEAARIRMDHPEASLEELAGLLNPPISKSGMNHRLRKLKEIAKALREGNYGKDN